METTKRLKSAIDSMFKNESEHLLVSERLHVYKNEYKKDVVKLLKQYYSNNNLDKNTFYTEVFNSKLGFYDAELLLSNLFLEKYAVSIINYLLRSGTLNEFWSINLPTFLELYLNDIQINFKNNSRLSEIDVLRLIQSYTETIINEKIESDWNKSNDISKLTRKFLDWFNGNLSDENVSSIYLIFIKLWNSEFEEKDSFNKNVIILYHLLINNLSEFMKNGGYYYFIQFIHSIENIKSNLFNDDFFFPIVDTKNSNKYSNGYITKRDEFNKLLTQARELLKLNSDYSYLELLKKVNDNSQEYIITRVNEIIREKITKLNYPDFIEVEKICKLNQGDKLNNIKYLLLKKLYLYECV